MNKELEETTKKKKENATEKVYIDKSNKKWLRSMKMCERDTMNDVVTRIRKIVVSEQQRPC